MGLLTLQLSPACCYLRPRISKSSLEQPALKDSQRVRPLM
jgi:hypothetical protein